jgi:hypothetical protein
MIKKPASLLEWPKIKKGSLVALWQPKPPIPKRVDFVRNQMRMGGALDTVSQERRKEEKKARMREYSAYMYGAKYSKMRKGEL